jgi:hypothetical protein
MEQNLSIAYRIILDDRSFGKTIGLETQLLARASITLVKINMQKAIKSTSTEVEPVLASSTAFTTSNQSNMPSGKKKLIRKSCGNSDEDCIMLQ